MNTKRIKILLIEDDYTDILITREVIENGKIIVDMEACFKADEALEKLMSGECQPDLILLDLNLPGMEGKEFIREVSKHEKLKKIPIVVLTASHSNVDIIKTHELRVSSYITKPLDSIQLIMIIRTVTDLYIELVKKI